MWSPGSSSRGIASYELVVGGTTRAECSGPSTSCVVRGLAEGRTYDWRVVGHSSTGRTATSGFSTFTTNAAPVVTGLLSDVDGLEQVPLELRISWAAATDPDGDAVRYTIQVAGPDVRAGVACATTAQTCDLPFTLRPGGTYRLTLEATDAIGLSASTSATFTARRPVVLIHGYMGDADTWDGMRQSLLGEGFPVLDFDASQAGVQAMAYDSIVDGGIAVVAVSEVAPRIEAALTRGGYAKNQPVDVVAHSMGGLVTRWLVEEAGETLTVRDYRVTTEAKWSTQVRTLVTLATPHHGSKWPYCLTDVCSDMAPESDFLEFLGYDPRPPTTRYYTVGGGEDAIVSAQSARLSTSEWTYIPDACHTESDCRIVGHPTALRVVMDALDMRKA